MQKIWYITELFYDIINSFYILLALIRSRPIEVYRGPSRLPRAIEGSLGPSKAP